MGNQPRPYQSVWGDTAPTTVHSGLGQFLVRQTFFVTADATLFGARFYRDRGDPGNHIAVLIKRATAGNRDGQRAAAFVRNPALVGQFGWNNKYLGQPLDLVANEWWDLVLWMTGGIYYSNDGALVGSGFSSGIITVPQDASTDPFGSVINNGARDNGTVNFNPNVSLGGALLGIDVLVLPK